ncbi:MAG: AmmeMemoRadiSam system protein A [Clostridium sp.]|nr:AmmeMemoRadiSam system protein A [Clostridium sp.]
MSILAGFMVPHPPMIVPAVGRGGEEQIAETTKAYIRAAEEIAAIKPDTIIISSPHIVMYSDYFHIPPAGRAKGSFGQFRAPQVRFEETCDTELIRRIGALAAEENLPAGPLGEREKDLDHGTMVPLWFIEKKYQDFKLVRLGLSGLPLTDHYRLGQLVNRAVEETGRRTVWVASGDLSHKLQEYGPYGFADEGPQYDEKIMDVCGRAAFGELFDFGETFCEKAAECGHRSFVMMAGAFDGLEVKAERLSHQDVTGVGYGICTFYPGEKKEERHFLDAWLKKQEKELQEKREASDAYVRLARASLENYILKKKRLALPEGLPEEMTGQRAGAFVSIHKHGKLRGCIGTFLPVTGSVAEEILRNAVSAATEDPRFDPITPEELPWLDISVDVLGTPEQVESPADLDPKKYGVIVSSGRKRGLLLPDLDGVDTAEDQIAICRQKGGIGKHEKVTLERFEVVRHH